MNMRTFAFFGAAAIAASLFAAGNALAWSTEQPTKQDQNSVTFTDPDSFKALEDKVNGKSSQSGFYFSGSVNSGGDSGFGTTGANPYGVQPLGRGSAFSWSPANNPYLRGGN
jgi:hypothetical protein